MHFAAQNACFFTLFALFGSKKMQNFAGHRPYFWDFGGDEKNSRKNLVYKFLSCAQKFITLNSREFFHLPQNPKNRGYDQQNFKKNDPHFCEKGVKNMHFARQNACFLPLFHKNGGHFFCPWIPQRQGFGYIFKKEG